MIAIFRPTTGYFNYTGNKAWTKGTDFLAAFGDANNDKNLTREEFRLKMDQNNDGYVSATEFKNVLGAFNDTYNGGVGLANAFSNSTANLDNFKVSVDSLFSSFNVNTAGASLNALTKEDFRGTDKLWGIGNRSFQGEFDPWLVAKDVQDTLARAEFTDMGSDPTPPPGNPTRQDVLSSNTRKNWFRGSDIVRTLDKNKDGKIDKNELAVLADSSGKIMASDIANVFNTQFKDTYNRNNTDGLSLTTNRTDASAYTDKDNLFTDLDRNRDGMVNAADFKGTASSIWGPRGWLRQNDINNIFGDIRFTPPVYR